jgi:hypothetical protein
LRYAQPSNTTGAFKKSSGKTAYGGSFGDWGVGWLQTNRIIVLLELFYM